jgi:deoxyribonuclease I
VSRQELFIFFLLVLAPLAPIHSTSYAGTSQNYYSPEDHRVLSESRDELEIRERVIRLNRSRLEPLGYNKWAKRSLYGEIELEQDSSGYYIKDVYCGRVVRQSVGPNQIPNNREINTEHTWPQSLGSRQEPFRGDLHHLYPADAEANSMRGNSPFGEVSGRPIKANCQARRGHIKSPGSEATTNTYGFEPPNEHKGNVARAMFYASVVYRKRIDPLQEHYLRKWHAEDPPDFEEIQRNNDVEEAQGNRNPFIDYPEAVDQISDF